MFLLHSPVPSLGMPTADAVLAAHAAAGRRAARARRPRSPPQTFFFWNFCKGGH